MRIAILINVVVIVCKRKKTKSVCAYVRLQSGFDYGQNASTYDDIVPDV